MRTNIKISWWVIILILFLIIDCVWHAFVWYPRWRENAISRFVAKQIRVVAIHTNDLSGIEIMDVNSGKPLWIEWGSEDNGQPSTVSYYYQGKNVFNVILSDRCIPRYEVNFYGKGKSVTWWTDRGGSGSFTERIFYDTNGDLSGHEIWYDHAWHTLIKQNGKNGIVVDGKWIQPTIGTNGMWTIE
jgi:hypothetical protein